MDTIAEQLAALIIASPRTVVFTGAGMSTESGLPDFRGDGGLWREGDRAGRRFEELASVEALDGDFAEFAEFYRWRITMVGEHAPHEGHVALARWQRAGRVASLVTQNVDGYHERAGSDVLALHGTIARVRCRDCDDEAPAETFLTDEGLQCRCGGRMRPGVVLFGEALPQGTIETAVDASRRATLFIVLGSSLAVSPANALPSLAKRNGAKLVIVNRDETPLHPIADLTHPGPIRDLLVAVDRRLL